MEGNNTLAAHIITTLRVKTHHDIVDVNGKKVPVKIGLAPIQKEGLEYEFTVVLNLEKDSFLYTSSKDRTSMFDGKHEKLSKETGKQIMQWLMEGKSKEDIEKDEVNNIINIMKMSKTIEELRKVYKKAKHKYPKFDEDFILICTDRSKELQSINEVH